MNGPVPFQIISILDELKLNDSEYVIILEAYLHDLKLELVKEHYKTK